MKKSNNFFGRKTFCAVVVLCVLSAVFLLNYYMMEAKSAYAFEPTNNATTENSTEIETNEGVEVFSYLTLLNDYYRNAKSKVEADGLSFCTFEEFFNHYYELDMDISDYTDMMAGLYTDESVEPLSSSSSSSGKSYTLKSLSKNYNPEETPVGVFKNGIPENANGFLTNHLYANICAGDIAIDTRSTFAGAGHTALICEVDKKIAGKSTTYIQTIEAIDDKVYYGYIDEKRVIEYGIVIVRPYRLNDSKIESAIEFCYEQLGKPYDFPLQKGRVNTSINSDKWYCSELIYAAYKYAGIYLCYPSSSDTWVFPFDIYYSSQVSFVPIFGCLDAKIYEKSGGVWKMRVYNGSDRKVTCIYNKKMCFTDDAVGWTNGLKDTTSKEIAANSYIDIDVSENWFATTIVICQTIGKNRCITYFNSLNATTKRMEVGKKVL